MSDFIKINLVSLVNHKLVYDLLPTEEKEFGLDKNCILKEDFKFKGEETINGAEFRFITGNYDNMSCEGQRLEVGMAAEKLHVIGFGYWGDICENLKVVYDDGSSEIIQIVLPDWSHSEKDDAMTQFLCREKEIRNAKIVLSSGRLKHLIYFHHFACGLDKNKIIKELIFPDNMFMHIFALSLEI